MSGTVRFTLSPTLGTGGSRDHNQQRTRKIMNNEIKLDAADAASMSEAVLVAAKKAAKKKAIQSAVKIVAARLDQELDARLQGVALDTVVSTTKSVTDDLVGRMARNLTAGAPDSPDTRYVVAAAWTDELDLKRGLGPSAYAVTIEASSWEEAEERARRVVLDDAREKSAWVDEADGLPFNEARDVLRRNGLRVGSPFVAPVCCLEDLSPCDGAPSPTVERPTSKPDPLASPASASLPSAQPEPPRPPIGLFSVHAPTNAISQPGQRTTSQPVFVAPVVGSADASAGPQQPVFVPPTVSTGTNTSAPIPLNVPTLTTATAPVKSSAPQSPIDDERSAQMLRAQEAQAFVAQRLPRTRDEAIGLDEARKLVPEIDEALFKDALETLCHEGIVKRKKRSAPFPVSKFFVPKPDDRVSVSHMRSYEELMAWPTAKAKAAAAPAPTATSPRSPPSAFPPAIAEAARRWKAPVTAAEAGVEDA